ncbi:MAG: ATP-binding cassette domain-containing protein [Bacteroidaceae bacterium]|nr:ATP-binding cassette domain-containing protein [Bacteroidaceae bacterium]
MSERTLIQLIDAVPDGPFHFAAPTNLTITEGETLILTGPNGSGKTTLANMLRGATRLSQGSRHTAANIRIEYVAFHDQYTSSVDTGASAYQMRWNQGAMDEDFEPRVRDVLGTLPASADLIDTADLMDRTIVSLSSGEWRRLQLVRVLAKEPQVLIIDNPFIGLDHAGRRVVADMLEQMTARRRMALVLITSREVVRLRVNGSGLRVKGAGLTGHPILEARNITVRYGRRTILKDFSLTIREGEHWALKGPNGSGKSTLLSLICADNPQGYACDITLFGRRRGTGESIWEIKKNIGFVSPEMYRAYRRNLPVKVIVASGLHDTTGLFRQPTADDIRQVSQWMERFGISGWADRSYMALSGGEQRWVLLCRAFVKNPQLLILDEPYHALDNHYRQQATQIICDYCSQPRRTLIMVSHYDEDFPPIIDHSVELKKEIEVDKGR